MNRLTAKHDELHEVV